jgi:vacuolar-type H+-ATPase subunit I/STV1
MTDIQWLVFFPQTPATPSSLRVLVWRRLQQAGALNLQAGAWMLPHTPAQEQLLKTLLTEVEQQGGSGFLLEAVAPSERIQAELIARFEDERSKEYQEFSERCQQFLQELEKETRAHKFTFAELEENEQDLLKLTRWLRKIQQRDFFPGPASRAVQQSIAHCRHTFQTFMTAVYEQEGLPPQSFEEELSGLREQA